MESFTISLNHFNPRSRMGSDATVYLIIMCFRYFNPRSRMGSDLQPIQHAGREKHFNPRSRMGSDVNIQNGCISIDKFQSTLPHGERLYVCTIGGHKFFISIHAPAWGATDLGVFNKPCIRISIHAPAWGATHVMSTIGNNIKNFNPRSRMGSDFFPTPNSS